MKLQFHPEAEEELLEAVSYYESKVGGLGERLLAEVQGAADRLREYPEIGAPLSPELRKLVLSRFPYYVIYSVAPGNVYVLALAHDRRRPGYWKERTRP
jgi:plasmid stabilization system protein ParE